MLSPWRDDGSVTVEFALVAPAVVLLLGGAASVLGVLAGAVALADAAGVVARAEGRGDEAAAASAVARLVPDARVEVSGDDPVCVRLSRTAPLPLLGALVPLEARSCAAGGGE